MRKIVEYDDDGTLLPDNLLWSSTRVEGKPSDLLSDGCHEIGAVSDLPRLPALPCADRQETCPGAPSRATPASSRS